MGTLKPGATYIYERDGNATYAREFGGTERKLIGIDYPTIEHVNWHEIMILARTNPALQNAVDRVIMLYKLIKETE